MHLRVVAYLLPVDRLVACCDCKACIDRPCRFPTTFRHSTASAGEVSASRPFVGVDLVIVVVVDVDFVLEKLVGCVDRVSWEKI
jgi:hypothetical protein